MTTQMIVRINPELKNKVNNVAKAEGKSVSEVVRELLEDYIKNRDISLYIDDLWQRIGDTLLSNNVNPQEIQRAIRDVRKDQRSEIRGRRSEVGDQRSEVRSQKTFRLQKSPSLNQKNGRILDH